MQSFSSGLAFFRQAGRVAWREKKCLKPSLYGIAAGIVVTLLALIPIGVVVAYLRKGIPGIVLTGTLGALLLCLQLACGELSAAVTAYWFHKHFVQTEGDNQKIPGLLIHTGMDWLIFVAASPFMAAQRWNSRRRATGAKPEEAWQEATYLIMPLMVVEKLDLKDSLPRITQLITERTLLGRKNIIGVRTLNRLIYTVLGIIAAGIGLAVFRLIHGVTGACLAILLASLFSLAAIFWTAFTRAAYYTCLYGGAQFNEATLKGKPTGETWAREMLAAILNR